MGNHSSDQNLCQKKKRTVPLNTVVCLPTASFSTCVPEFVLVVQLLSEVRAVCVRAGVCVYFCIFDSVGTEQTNRIALNALSTD